MSFARLWSLFNARVTCLSRVSQMKLITLMAGDEGKVKKGRETCSSWWTVPGRPPARTACLSGPFSPSPLAALSHRWAGTSLGDPGSRARPGQTRTHYPLINAHNTLAASELMKCNNLLFPTMWWLMLTEPHDGRLRPGRCYWNKKTWSPRSLCVDTAVFITRDNEGWENDVANSCHTLLQMQNEWTDLLHHNDHVSKW